MKPGPSPTGSIQGSILKETQPPTGIKSPVVQQSTGGLLELVNPSGVRSCCHNTPGAYWKPERRQVVSVRLSWVTDLLDHPLWLSGGAPLRALLPGSCICSPNAVGNACLLCSLQKSHL